MGGEVPSLTEEGRYKVSKSLDKSASLMTSLSKTLSQHEKTRAVFCDQPLSVQYDAFPGFKSALASFQSKETDSEAVSAAAEAAVEHELTVCHVELGGLDKLEADQKLNSHTSVNGMFLVLLAGTKSQNSVAGIVVKKP